MLCRRPQPRQDIGDDDEEAHLDDAVPIGDERMREMVHGQPKVLKSNHR